MLNKQILQFCFNRSSVVVEFLEVNAIIKNVHVIIFIR